MSNKYPGLDVLPDEVADDEQLARCIFDKRILEIGGRIKLKAFLPRKKQDCPPEWFQDISVDRFDHLTMDKAVELGKSRSEMRTSGSFLGWAILFAGRARQVDGVEVLSSPLCDGTNPAHADILLPELATTDKGAQRECLQDLAEGACWLARPATAAGS